MTMLDDTLSEGGRVVICVLFLVLVIWLCKVWPKKKVKK